MYNPGTAEAWKNCIAAAAQAHIPKSALDGPICCEIAFYFRRPQGHYGSGKNAAKLKDTAPRWHTARRGDRDNMDKAVLDSLTILGFWHDDSQVCDGWIKKLWCPPGMQPGAQITIVQLSDLLDVSDARKVFSEQAPVEALELFGTKGAAV